MGTVFRRGPTATAESHRVTPFEIFFDLVFVFAVTRAISFMTHSLTFLTLAQGLILLLLLAAGSRSFRAAHARRS
jgi:low temperature requirement protein LtrA